MWVESVLVLIVLLVIPMLQILANARETLVYDVLVPSHELKQEELLALMGQDEIEAFQVV